MIYRIGIWVKDEPAKDGASGPDYKFSHYATPDELRYLRVNTSGAVEQIRADGTWKLMIWTHKAEFGMYVLGRDHVKLSLAEVYENDYVADKPGEPISNAMLMYNIWQILQLNLYRTYVVGNIHDAHYPNIYKEAILP